MYNEKIIQYIDYMQPDMLEALAGFIKIPSISADKQQVTEALTYALNLGRDLGFEAHSYLDNQVGVIEIGHGDETLGILSHVDVVAPGDMKKWNTPPFQAVIKNEKIFGRGAIDDKGAIIASLYAMKAVLNLGFPLCKKIQLILGTQEEVEWTDMDAYVKQFPLPDYGFTPDGEFPLCNIEKGCMDITIEFPLGCISKDAGSLVSISAGTAANIVPGLCTAEIMENTDGVLVPCTHKALGRAVHSCQPEKGQNAIFNMAKHLSNLTLKQNRLLDLVYMINEKFSDLNGTALGLYSQSEYYNEEFVHRNVFTPTILNVENNIATLIVNVRYSYGTNAQDIINRFEDLAKYYGGSLTSFTNLPAVYVSKDRPFMQAFAKAYDQVSGRKNEFVLAYGGSYAKAMPNIVSWGPIFPEDEDTCHEENEYISIKSLMDNSKIFGVAISEIILSGKSFR
ncbi:Sapep family Mn(2+)-dependent dipeptidase [Aminipila sp.]|uniref:Sapep family Mn(2+)-dependent dipeptidase n=1 Tax=Aminipila sp. TaxID=2060095 RepID=UPI00289C2397|nr:Sapep family Mn(2+)-dependent dipeptidase [Aminipila sp.]